MGLFGKVLCTAPATQSPGPAAPQPRGAELSLAPPTFPAPAGYLLFTPGEHLLSGCCLHWLLPRLPLAACSLVLATVQSAEPAVVRPRNCQGACFLGRGVSAVGRGVWAGAQGHPLQGLRQGSHSRSCPLQPVSGFQPAHWVPGGIQQPPPHTHTHNTPLCLQYFLT